MASSWCKETDEKINYTKLCRLLVDGGTQAVRSVFDGIHPPSSLTAILNTNKTTLQKLKKPKGKVLNNEQWDKLYPPSGSNPKSEDFDITLLFVLLRNICGLTAPATGWDVLPPITDTSTEANLARIKYYRNNTIAHRSNTEINDVDFQQYWQDISSALLSLGLSQDEIDDLKSSRLGGKDYNQLLYDWYLSDEDIKTQLEDLKSNTTDIKSDTTDIKSDTTDIKSDTKAIKDDLDELKFMHAKTHGQHIDKLHISDFKNEISKQCNSFHPSTRQWILDQVKSHVESHQPESCIMLITAGPGMGKSTLAAKICQMYKDLGCLGGCHFFQFSNSIRNNPRLMLQSIARQMCEIVPGYEDALEKILQTDYGKKTDFGKELKCEELLTILLEEPLCNLEQPDTNFVIVIDALDECPYHPKNELMTALRNKLSCLPSWLRFIITSRPSTNTSVLGSTVAVKINPDNTHNLQDLDNFLSFELKTLYQQYSSKMLVPKLVQMTQGLFLVAFFVIDLLRRERVTSPWKVLELFPNGISSVYENYFSRLKEVLLPYIFEEERFYKMLEAVVVTKNPLPKNMVYDILGLKSDRDVPRAKKQARKDAMNSLHSLFPIESDHVTAFHKSVVDWLILQGDEEHDFSVRVEDGNKVLANQCYDVLSDIRNRKKELDKPLDLTDSEEYALRFVCDLLQTRPPAFYKDDMIDKFLNLYILSAMIPCTGIFIDDIYSHWFTGIISDKFLVIIDFGKKHFVTQCRHISSCSNRHPSTFGHYLEFVLQTAHTMGVTEETKPKPLDALKEYNFPYCKAIFEVEYRMEKLKDPYIYDNTDSESFGKREMPVLVYKKIPPPLYVSLSKAGFIGSHLISKMNPPTTVLYKYQLDGRCTGCKKIFGDRKMTTSPSINFIVVTEETGSKIEIVDVTTLEVVSQYQSPHDEIQTCHVFGDDRCWYIVIQGCNDNKVYVIEGLTGRLHTTIKVNEGSKVIDVSCQGHIVVTRTWKRDKPEERSTFTNKGGIVVEIMNWKILDSRPKTSSSQEGGENSNFEEGFHLFPDFIFDFTYKEMFLYNHEHAQKAIPIYPLAERTCHCRNNECSTFSGLSPDKAVQFSEDGRLLAYHYKDSIFIVNTSDGSLFKRWSFGGNLVLSYAQNILFVSECYIIMCEGDFLFIVNVETNEIEHRICLSYHMSPKYFYLPFPNEVGEPAFTLLFKDLDNVASQALRNLSILGLTICNFRLN